MVRIMLWFGAAWWSWLLLAGGEAHAQINPVYVPTPTIVQMGVQPIVSGDRRFVRINGNYNFMAFTPMFYPPWPRLGPAGMASVMPGLPPGPFAGGPMGFGGFQGGFMAFQGVGFGGMPMGFTQMGGFGMSMGGFGMPMGGFGMPMGGFGMQMGGFGMQMSMGGFRAFGPMWLR